MLTRRRGRAYTTQGPSVAPLSRPRRAECRLTPIAADPIDLDDWRHGSARDPLSPVCPRLAGRAGGLAEAARRRTSRRGARSDLAALAPDAGRTGHRPRDRLARRA